MHYAAAAASFVALLLYVDRSSWLTHHGSQGGFPLVTRVGVAGLLLFSATRFLTLASVDAPFAVGHWLYLGALVAVIVGHLGMLRGGRSEPT